MDFIACIGNFHVFVLNIPYSFSVTKLIEKRGGKKRNDAGSA